MTDSAQTRRDFLSAVGAMSAMRLVSDERWAAIERESRAFQLMMRDRHNIELKMVPKNWLNGIRVSTHLFNTEHDVDRLIAVLKSELA